MSSTLSAQEMAAHAAAFSSIKKRDLTEAEMLHIAKMHDGEANMAAMPSLAAIPSPDADVPLAAIPGSAQPSLEPIPSNASEPALAAIPQPASPVASMSSAEPPLAGAPDLQSIPQSAPAQSPAMMSSFSPGSLKGLAQKDDAQGDDLSRQADRKQQMAEAYQDAASTEEEEANADLAGARVDQAKQNALDFDKLSVEHAKAEDRLKGIIAQAEATAKAQEQKVRVASDAAQNFEMRDFYADKTTAGKIFAIISQVLAGGANYLAGQPGAPTPLDRIIADDLQKQQARLGQLNRAADREKDVLEQAYKATGSRLAAEAAVTDAAYGKVDTAMKAMAARLNTPVALANAKMADAAIKAKRGELYEKSAVALRDDAIKLSGNAAKASNDVAELAHKKDELAYKMQHEGASDNLQLSDVETPQGMPMAYKERLQKDVLAPASKTLDVIEDLKRTSGDESVGRLERFLSVRQNQAELTMMLKDDHHLGNRFSPTATALLQALTGGATLQNIAKLSTSSEYKQALTELESRVKNNVQASLGYKGVRIRPDSKFALKVAQPLPEQPKGGA